MHPSAIRTAPFLPTGQPSPEDGKDGLEAYTQDVLTVPASLAGLPALSMPVGLGADGWPIGVTVVSQWGSDEVLLQVGKKVEEIMANVQRAEGRTA